MPRLLALFPVLALVVIVALFAPPRNADATPTLGPGLEAQRAAAAQTGPSPARYAGHAKITCGTSASDIAVTMTGTNIKPTELFFFSDSTVIVRLISRNAVAATSGLPLCKTAGSCVNGITLPVEQHMVQCDSDGVATDIYVWAVAR